MINLKKKLIIFFVIYTIVLTYFVLFKFNFTINDLNDFINEFRSVNYKRVNLELFSSIKMQVNILDRWAILNLIANTVPFVILGLLYKYCFKTSLIKSIIISAIFILSLELIQLIFVIGTFDIDDILLNFISILIGVLFVEYVVFYSAILPENNETT